MYSRKQAHDDMLLLGPSCSVQLIFSSERPVLGSYLKPRKNLACITVEFREGAKPT